jgi:WD40 repeat protein
VLARSTDAGLDVVPFGRPFPPAPGTEHTLSFGPQLRVVGVATGGVTVWHARRAAPVNVKLYEVCNVAISPDTTEVAMGTRVGGVALSSAIVGNTNRIRPSRVEGHENPVIAMEFSTRGRWLATAAERCLVWSV